MPFLLLLATTWCQIVTNFMTGLRTTCCSFLGWLQRLGLKSWRILQQLYSLLFWLPQHDLKLRLPFKAAPCLLLLATTWFKIVTHFMTGLRTTCCSFLGWVQRVGLKSWRILQQLYSLLLFESKLRLLFKAAPCLLLLATTWFNIVTHFMTGLRTTSCSFLDWLQRLGLESWRTL